MSKRRIHPALAVFITLTATMLVAGEGLEARRTQLQPARRRVVLVSVDATQLLVTTDLGGVAEVRIVAHGDHVGGAYGLLEEVEHPFDGVRCPRLDQRSRPPSCRVEEGDGLAVPHLEEPRLLRPRTEAADGHADAIVQQAARAPRSTAHVCVSEYRVTLGGGQRSI
jgi:hypothetical protein